MVGKKKVRVVFEDVVMEVDENATKKDVEKMVDDLAYNRKLQLWVRVFDVEEKKEERLVH